MALIIIKHLGTKKSKSGKSYQSFVLCLCTYYNSIVKKLLSHIKRDKSCGCVQYELSSESHKGKKHTEEAKQRMRKAKIGKKHTEEHNKHIAESNKGKIVSEETKLKISNKNKGKRNTKEQIELLRQRNKNNSYRKGKLHTEETKLKIKATKIKNGDSKGKNNSMYGKIKELSTNWQGGISFEPYGLEFSKEFKQQIYERDNYTCQNPNCEHKTDILDAHHIDYNKQNNISENVITLCCSCHAKTNGKNNRIYWTEFYQNIMLAKIMECFL